MNRTVLTFRLAALALVLALEGVPAQQPADLARIPGILQFHDEPTTGVLTAPETARVGEEFQVTITTFGGGCEEAGDAGLVLGERNATIHVGDFTSATRPGVVCTAILKRLPHTLTLRFTEPGEAVVRVWGRQVGRYTPAGGSPVVLEYPCK